MSLSLAYSAPEVPRRSAVWTAARTAGLLVLALVASVIIGALFPLPAYGQDLGAAPPDALALLPLLVAAVKGHQYPVAVGIALTVLTFVLRRFVGPRWAWIKTDRGGAVFALLVALVGTLGAELAAGVTGWMTILDALAAALSSAGGYALVKKLLAPSDAPRPAAEVGAPAAPASPRGFASTLLLSALAMGLGLALLVFAFAPRSARAQEAKPVPAAAAPLAVALTPDLSLRLNVSVVAGSYDLTHKAWLGQGEIGGLYALTSKRLLDAGVIVGGAITFDTASRPAGTLNGGLVSPKLAISPTVALHGALLYGRRFGPDAANLFRFAPTLEF